MPITARGERTTGTSHIDRSLNETSPVYGAPSPKSGNIEDTAKGTYMPGYRADRGTKTMQNYELGHQYKDLFHKRHTKSAKLYDAPNGTVGDGDMHFEVTAVGLEGSDKGRFFGAVKWGYSTVAGVATLDAFEVSSMGTPSQEFNDRGSLEPGPRGQAEAGWQRAGAGGQPEDAHDEPSDVNPARRDERSRRPRPQDRRSRRRDRRPPLTGIDLKLPSGSSRRSGHTARKLLAQNDVT